MEAGQPQSKFTVLYQMTFDEFLDYGVSVEEYFSFLPNEASRDAAEAALFSAFVYITTEIPDKEWTDEQQASIRQLAEYYLKLEP